MTEPKKKRWMRLHWYYPSGFSFVFSESQLLKQPQGKDKNQRTGREEAASKGNRGKISV